jgi:hypothetical protein
MGQTNYTTPPGGGSGSGLWQVGPSADQIQNTNTDGISVVTTSGASVNSAISVINAQADPVTDDTATNIQATVQTADSQVVVQVDNSTTGGGTQYVADDAGGQLMCDDGTGNSTLLGLNPASIGFTANDAGTDVSIYEQTATAASVLLTDGSGDSSEIAADITSAYLLVVGSAGGQGQVSALADQAFMLATDGAGDTSQVQVTVTEII